MGELCSIRLFNLIFICLISCHLILLYSNFFPLGYAAKDNSFYASLHAGFAPQDREGLQTEMRALNSNMNIEYGGKEANENIEEADISVFTNFLENIRADYQNGSTQLRTALNKFEERYMVAKSKSIPQLVSLLYDLNSHLDLKVNIRGGSMIRVQIESVKR